MRIILLFNLYKFSFASRRDTNLVLHETDDVTAGAPPRQSFNAECRIQTRWQQPDSVDGWPMQYLHHTIANMPPTPLTSQPT